MNTVPISKTEKNSSWEKIKWMRSVSEKKWKIMTAYIRIMSIRYTYGIRFPVLTFTESLEKTVIARNETQELTFHDTSCSRIKDNSSV